MFMLLIHWSIFFTKAAQLITALAILVVLHESGHFLAAKLFGRRIEKFFLFFNPFFSLWKKKIGETEYGIGWVPRGGYVKISGMIDEGLDTEQLQQPQQPSEFRSKKAWQRLIIMIAGVAVNLVLGFSLFAMTLWVWGEEYLPAQNAVYGVYVDSLGRSIGLQDGDKITGVNGKELKSLDRLGSEIILREGKTIEVIRNGQELEIPIPKGTIRQLIKRKGDPLAYPCFPVVVDSVDKTASVASAGRQKDDQIIVLNGEPVNSLYQLNDLKKGFSNKEVSLAVLRGQQDTLIVNAILSPDGGIGFYPRPAGRFLNFVSVKYTFLESLPAGVTKGWNTLTENVRNLKLLFTSKEVKASESLGSLITIGN